MAQPENLKTKKQQQKNCDIGSVEMDLPGGFLQEVVFEGQGIRAGRGYDSLKCGDFMMPRKVDGESGGMQEKESQRTSPELHNVSIQEQSPANQCHP